MYSRDIKYTKINDLIVPLDSNIAEDVALLNSKGYRTTASCGGHMDENICLIHIVFDKAYEVQAPKYFKWYKTGVEFRLSQSKPKRQEKYDLAMQEFKQWVKDLPNNT